MKSQFMKIFIKAVIMTIVIGAIGILYNYIYQDGVKPFSVYKSPSDVLKNDPRTIISVEEIKQLWDNGSAVFIDTRSIEAYEKGHISGAFPLPYDNIEGYIQNVRDFVDPGMTIITYCDGEDCLSSLHVADYLGINGYPDIKIFFGGWELWSIKGYPMETGGLFE